IWVGHEVFEADAAVPGELGALGDGVGQRGGQWGEGGFSNEETGLASDMRGCWLVGVGLADGEDDGGRVRGALSVLLRGLGRVLLEVAHGEDGGAGAGSDTA